MEYTEAIGIFDTHKAFKVFSDAKFTEEQSEALVKFLNKQSIAESKLLSKNEFQASIDKKADKVDIKLLISQMDKRFEQVDNHFEAMQKQLDTRFESMQKQLDTRFESMQKQLDTRFEAMQQQMDVRFEQMNVRFGQMDKRFEQMDKRFAAMQHRLDSLMKWSISTSIALIALIITAIGSLLFQIA